MFQAIAFAVAASLNGVAELGVDACQCCKNKAEAHIRIQEPALKDATMCADSVFMSRMPC